MLGISPTMMIFVLLPLGIHVIPVYSLLTPPYLHVGLTCVVGTLLHLVFVLDHHREQIP